MIRPLASIAIDRRNSQDFNPAFFLNLSKPDLSPWSIDPVPIPAAAPRRLLSMQETNDLLQDLISERIFLRGEKGQHLEKISNLERQVKLLRQQLRIRSATLELRSISQTWNFEGSAPEGRSKPDQTEGGRSSAVLRAAPFSPLPQDKSINDFLPAEALSASFQHLDTVQKVLVRRVCKQWLEVMDGRKSLWRTVVLSMLSLESVPFIITQFDERSDSTLMEVSTELQDSVGQLDSHPLLQALQNSKATLQALSITMSEARDLPEILLDILPELPCLHAFKLQTLGERTWKEPL